MASSAFNFWQETLCCVIQVSLFKKESSLMNMYHGSSQRGRAVSPWCICKESLAVHWVIPVHTRKQEDSLLWLVPFLHSIHFRTMKHFALISSNTLAFFSQESTLNLTRVEHILDENKCFLRRNVVFLHHHPILFRIILLEQTPTCRIKAQQFG